MNTVKIQIIGSQIRTIDVGNYKKENNGAINVERMKLQNEINHPKTKVNVDRIIFVKDQKTRNFVKQMKSQYKATLKNADNRLKDLFLKSVAEAETPNWGDFKITIV